MNVPAFRVWGFVRQWRAIWRVFGPARFVRQALTVFRFATGMSIGRRCPVSCVGLLADMPEAIPSPSIESWLADVRVHVAVNAGELLPLLDVYLEEARFGRGYISADLMRLPPVAAVLEIGAGALLLSCQLVREGFDVAALEPIGGGFSHFGRMRELVLERAKVLGCLPRVLDQAAEALSECGCFDYAFSINVMEHVDDVALSIARVGASLKPGATYRFTCANYLFPYDPHFNIPTLFSKKLTERLLGSRIFRSRRITDPEGLWRSLNWINVVQVRRVVRSMPELSVSFDRELLTSTLERVVLDKEFSKRRSSWMRVGIGALVKLRLHYLACLVPASFQPIMDCAVTRTRVKRAL